MSGVRLQHVGFTFPPGREDDIRGFYGGTLGTIALTLFRSGHAGRVA